jgi:hypothetical protein
MSDLRKVCSKCGVEKDLSKFSKDKRRKDGYRYGCKECDSKSVKKYRKTNVEQINKKKFYRKSKISTW